MGAIGIYQILLVAIFAFVNIFPVWKILSRLGLSGWWSLVAFIPVVNLIALWVLAFIRWPRD